MDPAVFETLIINLIIMSLSTLFQSRTFRGVLYGIGITIVLLAVFQGGVFVGYRQAEFSYRWGERYLENFTGTQEGKGLDNRGMMNPHGVFGMVIKVDASSVVVKGPDNVEKIVLVSAGTQILRYEAAIAVTDLKADEKIVVIGSPNDQGQIEAKLIRVMPGDLPPMPEMQEVPQGQQALQQVPGSGQQVVPVQDGVQVQDGVSAQNSVSVQNGVQPSQTDLLQNDTQQSLPKIQQ